MVNKKSVLVPVTQFRVDYALAAGRPYSSLEVAALRLVGEGVKSVAGIRDQLRIHSRIIIEALVTLTQAGWIAFDEEGLLLTNEGERSITGGREPRNHVWRKSRAYLVMERVFGMLASNRDVRFISGNKLEDLGILASAIQVPKRVYVSTLDEGQVEALLYRGKGEWVSRIMAIHPQRKQNQWLHLRVDEVTGEVSNCPDQWSDALSPIVLKEAGVTRSVSDSWAFSKQRNLLARESVPVTLDPAQDLLTSAEEHVSCLKEAMENAKSVLVLISAFLRPQSLEEIQEALRSTIERGVSVVALWGYETTDPKICGEAIELLKKWRYDLREAKGRLEFNIEPVDSHLKALIWDGPEGFEFVVGSYNWLSSAPSKQLSEARGGVNTSVRLRSTGLLASLVRSVMGIWSRKEAPLTPTLTIRLARLAEELERQSVAPEVETAEGEESALIVRDVEHERLLNEVLTRAEHRLLIGSHKVNNIALQRLLAAERLRAEDGFQFLVQYGFGSGDDDAIAEMTKRLEKTGVRFQAVQGLHSKVVVCDNWVYVGTYNFLSADVYSTSQNSREAGILLRSEKLATALWKVMSELDQ